MIGVDAVMTVLAPRTASSSISVPSTTMHRLPMKQPSSMMFGRAPGGSSTPPIPTPPARWTFSPTCAQEPTVAQVSTIVPVPTRAPMFTKPGITTAPGAVLLPGFVNIGARVGAGTMVDTWATVGSCAQIGENVHLAGGVGIGGVLEPPGARPNIIEDGCFIGSRCIVVEGTLIEEEAVLGANTVITGSTPIIDVTGPKEVVYKGRVPARSVVIPGVRPKQYPAGTYHIPCALIVGRRSASTDKKVSLNQALRDFEVQV